MIRYVLVKGHPEVEVLPHRDRRDEWWMIGTRREDYGIGRHTAKEIRLRREVRRFAEKRCVSRDDHDGLTVLPIQERVR